MELRIYVHLSISASSLALHRGHSGGECFPDGVEVKLSFWPPPLRRSAELIHRVTFCEYWGQHQS